MKAVVPIIWLLLIVCSCRTSHKAQIGSVWVTCHGDVHHQQHIRSILGSHEHLQEVDSKPVAGGILPHCSLSYNSNEHILSGLAEITPSKLQNIATLLESKFRIVSAGAAKATDFLHVFGTLFEEHSYFKSAANLCHAIKDRSRELKCNFIDVAKNPVVFSQSSHSVPWIEIKTRSINASVIMTDKFPNLRKYLDKIGVREEKLTSPGLQSRPSLPQCSESECQQSSLGEPLLHTTKYWTEKVQPHVPQRASYLGSTGIVEAPLEILQILNGTVNITQQKHELVSAELTNAISYLCRCF